MHCIVIRYANARYVKSRSWSPNMPAKKAGPCADRYMLNPVVVVTKHARYRARKRAGWNRNATTRMACRALAYGFAPPDLSETGARYWLEDRCDRFNRSFPRIYAGFVFVFSPTPTEEHLLITVYPLPKEICRRIHGKRLTSAAKF